MVYCGESRDLDYVLVFEVVFFGFVVWRSLFDVVMFC